MIGLKCSRKIQKEVVMKDNSVNAVKVVPQDRLEDVLASNWRGTGVEFSSTPTGLVLAAYVDNGVWECYDGHAD